MEFKGTKGKWVLEDTENWINLIDSDGDRITSIDTCDSRSPYDALLISKAPEMLEMLEEFIYSCCGEQECEEELIKGLGITLYHSVLKAKSLIKQATEL